MITKEATYKNKLKLKKKSNRIKYPEVHVSYVVLLIQTLG